MLAITSSSSQLRACTAWSGASLQMDTPLIDAISSESLKKCSEFHSQCIANTAWAFAKLGMRNQTLMASLSAQAIAKISD